MPLVAHKPAQQLIDIVGTLGGRWTGYTALCRCPAHNDRTPSLSLRQGDRGVLVHCYAGCAREDVLRELGRIVPDRDDAAARHLLSDIGTGMRARGSGPGWMRPR